jgi:8-oxo-dGTP pyrophosphatase MutT (NUDIX family)
VALPAAPEPGPVVRDAATVVLVRRDPDGPRVLMGQRGGAAAFMPDKFVFPGGAVDADDLALEGEPPLELETARRLAMDTSPELFRALPRAAVRELWEETGLVLGRPDPSAATSPVPPSWRGFFAAGYVPHTSALRLMFRAITPPGRPRRFDARFFLAEADSLACGGENFAAAGDELAHLQWIDLATARGLPLPFITEVVLSEVAALLAEPGPRPVPFFHQQAGSMRYSLI